MNPCAPQSPSLPPLTEAEIAAAERTMCTPEYRKRVERIRARCQAGEPLNFPAMAVELQIPLQMVLAIFAKSVERQTGQTIRPIARVQ